MSLYLVRHAPVALQGLCYGQIDVPTTMDAQSAMVSVRRHLAPNFCADHVWSSPLARCAELASLFCASVRFEPNLMEASFGLWEGLSWDDIHSRYPIEMAAWGQNWLYRGPPEGESALAVQARFERWFSTLQPGCHLVFTHAGIVRAARVSLAGLSWETALSQPVPYLGVERFK